MHVFPLLKAKQICIGSVTKNLTIYRITTVLIKMNVLSNLSDSEFSIGHGFVTVTIATRYVADACCPKEPPYQI